VLLLFRPLNFIFWHCSPFLTRAKFRAVAKPEPDVPFEEAMQKLEAIVDAMESGELPLESLMAKFEEGTRLAKICQAKLAQAETKIQQLEKNAAGELTLRPMETNSGNE
jgi:exodeoxyribonuclease VII small subunit